MPCPYTAGRETVYGGEDPCSPQCSRSRTGRVLWMSKVFGVWVGRATHRTVSVSPQRRVSTESCLFSI